MTPSRIGLGCYIYGLCEKEIVFVRIQFDYLILR